MNYPQLLKHIMNEGVVVNPRGREVREVMKTQLTIEPYSNLYAWKNARPIEKIEGYLWEELAWYMSGERKAEHIAKFAGLWDKIKNSDGTLNSNYGFLVFYNRTWHPSLGLVTSTPFQWAVKCLKNDRYSRQAVMTYNTGGFNFEGNDDYICTQHQAFFIRDNVLRCFIALRSSDAIFGLTFNMPWWSLVHQQLWQYLKEFYPDLQLGDIELDIYSAHIYSIHYKLVESMLAEKPERYRLAVEQRIPISGNLELSWYRENLKNYITITKQGDEK